MLGTVNGKGCRVFPLQIKLFTTFFDYELCRHIRVSCYMHAVTALLRV